MKMTQSKQQGFSVIELISVLVIIAILAVTLMPKYVNLSQEVHVANAKHLSSQLKTSIDMVRMTFLIQGHSTRVQNLSGYGDGNMDTNNQGYPIGIDKGNGNENVGRNNKGCAELWQGLMNDAPTVAHNNNNQSYRSYRHTSNRVCSYVFRGSGDLGNQNSGQIIIRYDTRDGSVKVCGASDLLDAC